MYRKITFIQTNEKEWGFPLSHLLGMRLLRSAQRPNEPSETLTLNFSAETVKVTGTGLDNLWGKLVLARPDREDGCIIIATGNYAYQGRSYAITKIVSIAEV